MNLKDASVFYRMEIKTLQCKRSEGKTRDGRKPLLSTIKTKSTTRTTTSEALTVWSKGIPSYVGLPELSREPSSFYGRPFGWANLSSECRPGMPA